MPESVTLHRGLNSLLYAAATAPAAPTLPTDAAYDVLDQQISHTWTGSGDEFRARNKRSSGIGYSSPTESLTIQCHRSRVAADGQSILDTAYANGAEIWVLDCPTGLSQTGKWAKCVVGNRTQTSAVGEFETVEFTLGVVTGPTTFTTPAS